MSSSVTQEQILIRVCLYHQKKVEVMASFMLQGSNFEANCVENFFQLSKTHGNEINFLEFTIEYF